jgi:hypothetical protein
METYLDDLQTYLNKATVVRANLGYEAALANGGPLIQRVLYNAMLSRCAADTSQTEELRLRALTLLVNGFWLNEVPAPYGIQNLYQPISDTTTTATEWGLITGDINNQTDLIAKFNTYLPLSAGSTKLVTDTIFFGANNKGIDVFTETDTLNIGASAGVVQFGLDALIRVGTIDQGLWAGTAIGISKGGTGQAALGLALQVLRTNAAANATEWATLTVGTGDVVGPASATDNAIARFDSTTGKLIQNSVVLISDTGNVVGLGTLNTHTIQGGTASTFALYTNKLSVFAQTSSAELYGVMSDKTGNAGLLVFSVGPTLVNPILGNATGTSLIVSGALTSGVASTTAGLLVLRNAVNAFTQTIRGTGLAASRIFDLPIADPTAGQVISGTISGGTITLAWASVLTNPLTTLGDLLFGGASGVPTRLAGNITTVRQFLISQGSGSLATAPTLGPLVIGDIPIITLAKGGTGAALVDPNANRFFFWDDTTGTTVFAVLGDGLAYNAITKTVSVDATGIVVSVSGTANRITSTGGSTPVIDIASTYVGQASIVIVGTIGSGTWEAAIIDGVFGGTGLDVTTLTPGNSIRVNGGGTAWEEYTPSGGGGSTTNSAFTGQTTVTITHSLGYYPLVQVIDNTGALIAPLTTTHGSVNAFTVTFSTSTTGTIIYN